MDVQCTSPMMLQHLRNYITISSDRLETQLNEPTNQNSIEIPKFVKPTKSFCENTTKRPLRGVITKGTIPENLLYNFWNQ